MPVENMHFMPAITSLTSVENMHFMPPAEVLYTPPPPASKRRCGSSSSSAPAQRQSEDDTVPDIQVDHTPDPSIEYLLPAYTGQYDPASEPVRMTGDISDVAGRGDTDTMVADDAAEESSDGTGDAERGSRLHRSRRAPGQSRSCSPRRPP
ncbi:hypothetical protein Bca52824_023964 [Brassica carinata]|uniref:Uncharacterized protein n=1 Tax=Brassica carinata TaxID=52824 RepID=A0A8X7VJI8_BRACI|nr:hypothetical protein Bca52824_023964 [Brassica carinata]